MPRFLLIGLGLLLLTLFAAPRTDAQEGVLQPDADAQFGVVSLAPGFTPDPLRVPSLTGGGKIDAINRQLGPDCAGFISEAPDLRVALDAMLPLLRLILIADAVTVDTTLIVRAPDGVFWCGNNSNGLFNPMVSIPNAAPGAYAVWIGGFTPEESVFGDLFLTTNAAATPGSTGLIMPIATTAPTPVPPGLLTPTPIPGAVPDPARPPAHGDVALEHGFLPDPYWALVVGGGEITVPPLAAGNPAACSGFASAAPDARLTWSGLSPRLRIMLQAVNDAADPALIVHTPDGRWLCNADFAPGFTDPLVEILDPAPGEYAIWAANQSAPGVRFLAELSISEKNETPETVKSPLTPALAAIAGLDPAPGVNPVVFDDSSPDAYALVALPGFAAGDVDVAALNPPPEGQTLPVCAGLTTAQPTITVNLTVPTPYLRVFFEGNDGVDATLAVRMPDGRWYCSDDTYSSKDPTVTILGPAVSGLAEIWVGSFSPVEGYIPGSLWLTRGASSPNSRFGTPFTGLDEINSAPPASQSVATAGPRAFGPLLPGEPPNSGSAALNSATPPYTVAVMAGGVQDASKADSTCVGAVSAAPDFRLDWGGAAAPLRFFVTGEGDPTLLVLGPDGVLRCNDDSEGSVYPTVELPSAQAGAYFVWVGSFDPALSSPGQLHITDDLTRTPLNP